MKLLGCMDDQAHILQFTRQVPAVWIWSTLQYGPLAVGCIASGSAL